MRTTLNLDDDVLAAARILADEKGTSLGVAVSELARRGLRPRRATSRSGVPVFDVPPDAPPITPSMVGDALEEP